MPVYEYKCNKCGATTELLESGSSIGERVVCGSCGSTDVEKLLSAPVVGLGRRAPGTTCCGREERCDSPPCSEGGTCRR